MKGKQFIIFSRKIVLVTDFMGKNLYVDQLSSVSQEIHQLHDNEKLQTQNFISPNCFKFSANAYNGVTLS